MVLVENICYNYNGSDKMIAMPKEKMIQYLRDYTYIQEIMIHNPDLPIGRVFDEYMKLNGRFEDDTREYFDRMRRVYSSYNAIKEFSIIEDFLLNRDDFLSNNDLAGIESDCNIIIAPSDLTNKKIVQLIRNAFNHNDSDDIDRFKISENARYFEIEFKDIRIAKEISNGVKPKPVKIKFNFDYLMKISEIIEAKRQNQLFLSFDISDDFDIYSDNLDVELDKIMFVHYYFNKKLSKETIARFTELGKIHGLTQEELTDRSNELNALASSISEPLKFHLDKYQRRKIKDLIIRYRTNYKELVNGHTNDIMFDLLSKVIPVPAFKQDGIEQQVILCEGYFCDTNMTINEVIRRLFRVIKEEEKPSFYDDIDSEVHDLLSLKEQSFLIGFYKNIIDGEFMNVLPFVTYIESVVIHYCKDNTIKIAGKVYDREKIRNSFVHSRWYITKDYKIAMFDADPRNINDYNLEFIGNIPLKEFGIWADEYMENSEKRRKNLR